jgi:hypothetical protein
MRQPHFRHRRFNPFASTASANRYKKVVAGGSVRMHTFHVHQDALRGRLAGMGSCRARRLESGPHAGRLRAFALRSVGLTAAGPSAGSASRVLDHGGRRCPGGSAQSPNRQATSAPRVGGECAGDRWAPRFDRLGFDPLAGGGVAGFAPIRIPAHFLHDWYEPGFPAAPANRGGSRLLDCRLAPKNKERQQ